MLQMRFVVPLPRRARNPSPQSHNEGTESFEVDVSDPVVCQTISLLGPDC